MPRSTNYFYKLSLLVTNPLSLFDTALKAKSEISEFTTSKETFLGNFRFDIFINSFKFDYLRTLSLSTNLCLVTNLFDFSKSLVLLGLSEQLSKVNLFITTNFLNSPQAAYTSRDFSSKEASPLSIQSYNLSNLYNSHEHASDYRFQKTQNPVFRYDFRVGHYMTDNVKTLNKHMFTTFNDVTPGIRRAP